MKCNSCSPVTGLRNCRNDATLCCPICRKLGVETELSVFCCQKCFRDSWSEHKPLHEGRKKSFHHDHADPELAPLCESDSTHHDIVQLTANLAATQEQLSDQERQSSEYQTVIQNLTSEVLNLREEAKSDFLAASKEEEDNELTRRELAGQLKALEEEWQKKVDHAESEAETAVNLLRSRDNEIKELQNDVCAAAETVEKEKMDFRESTDLLHSQITSLQTLLCDKDAQHEHTKQTHIIEMQAKENSTRLAAEELYRQEVATVQAKASTELRDKLKQCEENCRQNCKKEEADALLSLRSQLEGEMKKGKEVMTVEHEKATQHLLKRAEEEKVDALAAQEATLAADHAAVVAALSTQHEEDQRKQIVQVESNAAERLRLMVASHQQQVDCLTSSNSILERKLSELERSQRDAMESALADCRREGEELVAHAVKKTRGEMQTSVDTAIAERAEFLQLYTKENKARKAIHNKLMDIQGNIRVICRVRPVLDVERKQAKGVDIDATEILSEEDLVIHRDKFAKSKFEFDRVFSPGGSQESVFEAVQPLVISVLDGYNVCIFAYGQTGSGKTFTMEGYGDAPEDKGVSPRAIHDVFSSIDEAAENWTYTVKFSMLEIYNETIRDLLLDTAAGGGGSIRDTAPPKLDIRQTSSGNIVTGLTETEVKKPDEVMTLMTRGQRNRAVGAHDMNEHSSRSHSILTLTVHGVNNKDGSTSCGKLHLIDLAGSERVGKTDATGDRLKEAQNINRSLSALGDVINSLGSKKSSHVPYRNSKLTFLLQDSLGGNSKVMMFVNISPAVYNVNESICSLNFASRCRNVELGQAKKQTGAAASTSNGSVNGSSNGNGTSGRGSGSSNGSQQSEGSASLLLRKNSSGAGVRRTLSARK